MDNTASTVISGTLYVVATPIGNRDDITLRALKILKDVDLIAAEDTRHTGRFLSLHSIKGNLISYHEHNERERTPDLIGRLKAGSSVALVSNAGTPLLSDPGYRLVKEAVAAGVNIVPIPGVSAAITALSASGLPIDSFVFIGFCPKKNQKRLDLLKELNKEKRTIVFYESPKRIMRFIEELFDVMGERYCVLSRELTKLHEEIIRGTQTEILYALKQRSELKGEITLLISGYEEKDNYSSDILIKELTESICEHNTPLSVLAKEKAKKFGLSKKQVYEEALKIKKEQLE
ncbi:MAG: 16S rRNA (cytidine(1402)-2'-O)-methyltransferase [Proteobacteria bacterium]|nr:16S rRNA (cytidine(1402)-2'-O)-methyltransferase [Pseudomonadota bacterium]MBU4009681.1 16S rRNA (cytidine(1402)-2'-O)-methyltransferase [Pseudomonadota bacterium]